MRCNVLLGWFALDFEIAVGNGSPALDRFRVGMKSKLAVPPVGSMVCVPNFALLRSCEGLFLPRLLFFGGPLG